MKLVTLKCNRCMYLESKPMHMEEAMVKWGSYCPECKKGVLYVEADK
jgi:ribosomal protein L33